MEALPPRRRHLERALYAKRLPQIQVGDPLPGLHPSLATDLPFPSLPGGPAVPVPTPDDTVTTTTALTSATSATSSTSRSHHIRSTAPAVVQTTPTPQTTQTTQTTIAAPANTTTAGAALGSAHGSGSLSKGGIAAVVLVSLIAVVALVVLVIRTRFRNMRSRKRATWGGVILPKLEDAIQEKPTLPRTPPPQYPFSPSAVLPRPPMSYNNGTFDSPTGLTPTGASPVSLSTFATIRCTFIPNLPDELSITTGETVRVLDEYDDGWALCANTRGEQGMVPLECLDKRVASPSQANGGADWRNAQRASSLGSPVGTKY